MNRDSGRPIDPFLLCIFCLIFCSSAAVYSVPPLWTQSQQISLGSAYSSEADACSRDDEVYVVYAEFVSMGKQLPVAKQILPIPPIESEETEEDANAPYLAEHICEPSPEELLGDLLPRNVYVQLFSALLETSTSEHAARMTAMDNATKACNDMIENLTLAYNKARQAAVTAELMDIVGGAEALKG